MFVAKTDFDRLPYNIVGLNAPTTSSGNFSDFINYNEEKYLRELFGNIFYDALATAFPLIPSLYVATQPYAIGDHVVYVSGNVADIYICIQAGTGQTPATATTYWTIQPAHTSKRWARLVYGDQYLYYQRTQKWYGMKRIVVPLIYALWTKYTFDNQTGSGVVTAKNENSITISPAVRVARAMNEYASLCAGDWPHVVDWTVILWPELENSLFGYLYLNSDVWNDVTASGPGGSFKAYLAYSFEFPGFTNVFGI